MPFLGLVPELPGSKKKSPPAAHAIQEPFDLYSEAIRSLQGNVLLARVGESRARTVLVTSAHAGEGKTSTAASLARVFSMGGYRTIVVDADLRAPGIHEAMGLMAQHGLSDLLMGRVRFEHVIRQDVMSPAHVIQAGSPVANPTAAIASSQMLWVLNALRQTYDIVIIDSPAALAAADAQVLSKMTDVSPGRVSGAEDALGCEQPPGRRPADTRRHAPLPPLQRNGPGTLSGPARYLSSCQRPSIRRAHRRAPDHPPGRGITIPKRPGGPNSDRIRPALHSCVRKQAPQPCRGLRPAS
jgi:capsular exopolysaccharide synthesis family protein